MSELVDALFAAAEKFDKPVPRNHVLAKPPFFVKVRRRADGLPSYGVIDSNGELMWDGARVCVFGDPEEAGRVCLGMNEEAR